MIINNDKMVKELKVLDDVLKENFYLLMRKGEYDRAVAVAEEYKRWGYDTQPLIDYYKENRYKK